MRHEKKLTSLAVTKQSTPGLYGDGAGLWLQVMASGSKSWIFRYMRNGRAREMGLGPVRDVTLAQAREKASECRRLLLDGKDPIEIRNESRQAERLREAHALTFFQCADSYIDAHRHGWKNEKHVSQWRNTLRDYVHPVLGALSVQDITTALVLKCLEPIWVSKPETATRVRGRIESILDWAKARGYRQGDNPAAWRGHLDHLLPARNKIARVQHHPALPYPEIGEFIISLRDQEGIAARALEFTIRTAARTNEVILATWDEFDLDKRLWVVPAERMKAKREHRVPLSEPVITLLTNMKAIKVSSYVFPGTKENKPLSNMAMLKLLERMGRSDITAHGFRSTFRDWAAEVTAFPRDVAEMALAHTISNDVEEAYRRGDLLQKRFRLMEEWSNYCDTIQGASISQVVPIRHAKSNLA